MQHSFLIAFAALGGIGLAVVACSANTTIVSPGTSGADSGAAANEDSGSPVSANDSGTDAAVDAGPTGTPTQGAADKSCTDSCKTAGMKCVTACDFGTAGTLRAGTYAGHGKYSNTSNSSSGSFTVYGDRYEPSCATVISTSWNDNPEDPGTTYTLDDSFGPPVSCCCTN